MQGIDLRLLRAFVKLVETGNYGLTAKALFITQPALSKQIQALESLTGGQLFLRGRHGATTTTFGGQLYAQAKSILQSHDNFLTYAKQINKKYQQTLSIGFSLSTYQKIPLWVDQFVKQRPDCQVTLNQLPSSVQINMLLEGSLQIGFLRMPFTNQLSSQLIAHEKLALAIPSCSPIDWHNLSAILKHYPLYQLDKDCFPCLAEQTEQFLIQNQLQPNKILINGDLTTLLALVAGGNAIAFMPQSMKQFLPRNVKLIIPKQKTVHWDIAMVWNAEIMCDFRDIFIDVVNKNGGKMQGNHY